MTKSIINSPLESYIYAYEGVSHFKTQHLMLGGLSVIAAGVVGALVYAVLTWSALPLNFGMVGNSVASATAGSLVLATAIISLQFHYASKIPILYRNSSEESFLAALIDTSTAQIFSEDHGKGNWVGWRFRFMLLTQFPEENWQGMMHYFDQKFFKDSACRYSTSSKKQAFNTFFKADPERFIKNYYEMRAREELSEECIQFLDSIICPNLFNLKFKAWACLIVQIDESYFLKKCSLPDKVQFAFLQAMVDKDAKKFKRACKYGRKKHLFSSKFTEFIEFNFPELQKTASPRLTHVSQEPNN